MRPAILLILVIILNCGLLGCKTAPIPDFPPIFVPQGMTVIEVETAILITLVADEPLILEAETPPTPEQLEIILRRSALRPLDKTPRWQLKQRRKMSVEAEYVRRSFTLLLELRYDEEKIQPSIIGSKNLKQSKNRIHKAAILWAQQFSDRIRGSLRWVRQFPTETEPAEGAP